MLGSDGGGTLPNVNRWRAQLGQPPLTSDDTLETLQVLGKPATPVEADGTYRGMGEANLLGAALPGLVCDLSGKVLFVKMTGPSAVVRREKKNFAKFCESLRLSS